MVEEVGAWFYDDVVDENAPLAAAMQQVEGSFGRMGEAARQSGQAVSQYRDMIENSWGAWDRGIVRYEPGSHIGTTWLTDDREVEISTRTPRYNVRNMLRPIRSEVDMDIRRRTRINVEYEDGTIIGAAIDRLAAGYMLTPQGRMESMTTAQVGDVLETVRRMGRPEVQWVHRDPVEFRIRPQMEYVERPTTRIITYQVQSYLIPTHTPLMILHGA